MILLHAVRLTAAAAAVRPEDAASEQRTALQLQEQACKRTGSQPGSSAGRRVRVIVRRFVYLL